MTKTRDITIQGVIFTVSTPFEAGHVVTEAEAAALNQTRCENIRNNMATKVKAAQKELPEGETALSEETLAELAAEVAAYDAEYEFSMASAGGGSKPKDPIEAEAVKLAKAAIAGQLKSKGTTVKAYLEVEGNKAKYDEAIAKLAAHPDYLKAAKKAVQDREKLASAGIESLAL
jgi:hypothetical protein